MNHRAHLHSVYLPKSVSGTPYLWFDSLQGVESINGLFEYKLIVKAKDEHGNPAHGIEGLEGYVSFEAYHGSIIHPKEATPHQDTISYQSVASHLDLTALIGTPLGISLDLNDKHPIDDRTITGQVTRHGIITGCAKLTTHNRHAVYELTLSPWTYLLTKTNNYHIHQHKSIPQIIEEVLSCYPYPWQFELTHDYPKQDYQTQYDESDHAFITRLMSEHGISFYFEHTKDNHTLIITDHVSHLKRHANPFYDTLTLNLPNQRMPAYAEYLEHFTPKSRLTCAQSLLSDYQFKAPNEPLMAHDTIKGVQTDTHKPHQALIHHLQRYEWHQGRRAGGDELATKNEQLTAAYRHQSLSATAHGRLKGIQVAHLFTLTGHPHQSMNTDWVVYALQMSIKPIDEDNNTHQYYTADTSFTAYPATHPLVPTTPCPRPPARTQTATVVAQEGEEIHTDQYGRIKVKFHWDKPTLAQRHLVDNRTGDDKDDLSQINTCYLRVASTWAGDHYGHIALPRAGQEVIIDFFGGNPDMPYVAGSLTNPNNMPLYTLPHEKVLSGIRSKEYGGDKSNQLIMDDTKDKLQTHLKSDHLHTEINLGHIRRLTTPQGRGEYRGEGFEVRTDGHGVIRADKGMVITTHGRQGAVGHVKDVGEAEMLIRSAKNQQASYMQAMIDYMAEDRDLLETATPALSDDYGTIKASQENEYDEDETDDTGELSLPHILLASASSLIGVAKKNIHQYATEHITFSSGADLNIATGKKLLASVAKGIGILAHDMGIKMIAASGNINISAQRNDIDIVAEEVLRLISKRKKIEISAMEEIVLNVQGNYIKILPDKIEQGTKGEWIVHANKHELSSPNTIEFELPQDPYDEMYVITDSNGNPVSGFAYKITTDDGRVYRGITNEKGETIRVGTANKAVGLTIEEDEGE
ncbi:type VI secretion system Vgr family protein [Moraxella bovis]|uniref:Type VI secretion system tip protein VgrG n=2 Tax=Moraxella bovis TaxID=476 RepID=A0AAX3EUL1_MORBO|nr:type VI secretion system Vgr family protein [Moraxella bovis]AWY21186.1 type VI secretion system tip protein VgrG [Moraxella bovis]UZA03596.1 type VI secretion system tip protein VgrG [Moraxella bovis]UZA08076.1 type VI secretion system tip protein VgrG [Moraxella bovis]UZA35044.1 type VI secretion system tip protein VgrG [Moraxella bovis]UZA51270.1 type VI secretion system tip protein VgrG [Moraxella bovis]